MNMKNPPKSRENILMNFLCTLVRRIDPSTSVSFKDYNNITSLCQDTSRQNIDYFS